MNKRIEYSIEYYFSETKYNKNGEIEMSPLDILFRFNESKKDLVGFNRGDLTFVGDEVFRSKLFKDIKLHDLAFYGEPPEIRYRESWATSIRAKIIQKLSIEENSWYISFVNYSPFSEIFNNNSQASPQLRKYFIKKNPKKMVTVNSRKPPILGKGFGKRLFFEVKNEEIYEVINLIWPESVERYSIQGFNFKSGQIEQLRYWDQEERNEQLFRQVVDKSRIMFFTYPEEHRDISFLTNKITKEAFLELIQLDQLRTEAEEILRKLGYK